jgi:uracil phosphoribosyltransferase
MRHIIIVKDEYIEALKLRIRDMRTDGARIARDLQLLGQEMAKHLVKHFFLEQRQVVTPMDHTVDGLAPAIPQCVIVSKHEEHAHFATGAQYILDGSERGFVDFGGKRGPEVSKREPVGVKFPSLRGNDVDTIVVAKAGIAGGCTVKEMARLATEKYGPCRIVFMAAFYTREGVDGIRREFAKGTFVVAGDPDTLNNERMLIPGIGQLNERLRSAKDVD